jgi:hypothetical protein
VGIPRLDRLVSTGTLKAEPPAREELEGLLRSGRARLNDARKATLSIESRFDLAYNAAHAFALAALRAHGYRSESRYAVFQALQDTVGLAPAQWRVLDAAHRKRNLAEYEGDTELDEATVEALTRITGELETRVAALISPAPTQKRS